MLLKLTVHWHCQGPGCPRAKARVQEQMTGRTRLFSSLSLLLLAWDGGPPSPGDSQQGNKQELLCTPYILTPPRLPSHCLGLAPLTQSADAVARVSGVWGWKPVRVPGFQVLPSFPSWIFWSWVLRTGAQLGGLRAQKHAESRAGKGSQVSVEAAYILSKARPLEPGIAGLNPVLLVQLYDTDKCSYLLQPQFPCL